MQRVKACFYKRIREQCNWNIKFWQKGFYHGLLEDEDAIYRSVRYLGNNPGVAGLSDKYFAWPYAFLDEQSINQYIS